MTNTDAAKNDAFDLQDFLPYLLNRAAEECSLEFQRVYKERYGILRTEWRVLFHLGNYGEMTAKEIGERARIHKTKISRAVSKLEQRRYLTRTPSQNDRRVEHLTLTSAGQSVYRDLREVAKRYDARLANMIGLDDASQLRGMLRKLADMG
jgi:DNA-binding MarR family transcriptional regulator